MIMTVCETTEFSVCWSHIEVLFIILNISIMSMIYFTIKKQSGLGSDNGLKNCPFLIHIAIFYLMYPIQY